MLSAFNLVQEDTSLNKVRNASNNGNDNGMSTFHHIQNLHPSQQVANSEEHELSTLLSHVPREGAISASHVL